VAHVWRGERPRRTTSSPVVRTECWACEDRPKGRERSRLSVHREPHRPQGPRTAPRQFSPVIKLDAVSDGFNVPEAPNVQDDRIRPLWRGHALGLKERRGDRTGQPSGSKSVACEERRALNVGGPCTSPVRAGVCEGNDRSLAKGCRGVRPSRSTRSAGKPRTWGRGRRCCALGNAGMGGKEWPRTHATGSLNTTRARVVRTCRAKK
jgi:hypothetical protein